MTEAIQRENYLGAVQLILLFTSNQCAWCDIVKGMLQNEFLDLGIPSVIHEVNIEHQPRIAEVYGIMMVPTLVSRGCLISGVPTQDDLRAFLLQSLSERMHIKSERKAAKAIRSAPRKYELRRLLDNTTLKPLSASTK